MSKLYQTLEQVFQMRINSNSEIIPYIKKLSEMGKFDEPKKIAAIAILLDRLAKLEDEADAQKSLAEIVTPQTITETASVQEINPSASSEVVATEEKPIVEEQPANPETTPIETVQPSIEEQSTPNENVEPTVSEFTPENITDPQPVSPTPDSTITS